MDGLCKEAWDDIRGRLIRKIFDMKYFNEFSKSEVKEYEPKYGNNEELIKSYDVFMHNCSQAYNHILSLRKKIRENKRQSLTGPETQYVAKTALTILDAYCSFEELNKIVQLPQLMLEMTEIIVNSSILTKDSEMNVKKGKKLMKERLKQIKEELSEVLSRYDDETEHLYEEVDNESRNESNTEQIPTA